ncbi:flgN protein [bacterium BMS3Bbin07]|nr:flgN protein [bacterium BMS3Bbin07]HDH01512.1 flagellar protein FlgN [Nitrospirota bacterium]
MKDSARILKILEEQVKSYSRLYDLLKGEKAAIVSFNPLAVESLAKEKDNLVLQLRLLEEERKRLADEFFGDREGGGSISDLHSITGNKKFLDLRSQLLSLMQGIGELNEINRLLIERASLHLRVSSAFFQTFDIKASPSGTISREA